MLDKKRTIEAENNVKRYLEEGLLKKTRDYNEDIFNTFKKNSEDGYERLDIENKDFSAKEEALELAGVKADELIESFDFERIKRSRFQYEMTEPIKRIKAETSLNRAKKFIFEMEKILLKN